MNKLRGSFANMPWFTGKVGIDLGRNGSRPLDLNPRAGAKGGDNRRRRGPADGGAWPGAHRSRRSRRPGLDLARYLDGEHEYATVNSIRASAQGIARGQNSRRRAASAARRRAKPWGEKREREEERVGELHNLDAKLLGGELVDGKQWNGVAAAGSESSTRRRG